MRNCFVWFTKFLRWRELFLLVTENTVSKTTSAFFCSLEKMSSYLLILWFFSTSVRILTFMAFYLFFSLSPSLQGCSSAKIMSYETPASGPIQVCTISFLSVQNLGPVLNVSSLMMGFLLSGLHTGCVPPPKGPVVLLVLPCSLHLTLSFSMDTVAGPTSLEIFLRQNMATKVFKYHILYYLIFTIKLKNSSLKTDLILKASHINSNILFYPPFTSKPSVSRVPLWK